MNTLFKYFVVYLLLLFYSGLTTAASYDVANNSEANITSYFTYTFDDSFSEDSAFQFFNKNKGLSIESHFLNLGYEHKNVWFHAKIKNSSEIPIEKILVYQVALIQYVDIYLYKNGELVYKNNLGDMRGIENNYISNRNVTEKFFFDANSEYDLLINVRNTIDIRFKILLDDEKNYFKDEQVKVIGFGAYIGVFFTLALYNLGRAVYNRDSFPFLLSIYIMASSVYVLNFYGFTYKYWFFETPQIIYFLDFYSLLSCVFFSGYIFSVFLKRNNLFLNAKKCIDLILLLQFLLAISSIFTGYEGIAFFSQILLYEAALMISVILLCSFLLFFKYDYQISLFAFGWLLLALTGLISIASVFSWVNDVSQNNNIFTFGLLAQVLVFTVSISAAVSEEAKKRVRAVAINDAKINFLSKMSHEIRTPINGILGALNLLDTDGFDEEQKTYTASMRSAGDSLLLLVNELLDYSAIDASELKVDRQVFKLKNSIKRLQGVFVGLEQAGGNKLLIDLDENLPDFFIGDPVRIEQVLINLIANAFKYSEAGIIRLSIKESNDGSGTWYFSVKDNGKGISQDIQQELFSAFKKGDTVDSMVSTGLGLAICKQLVELMGGNIGVNSEVGKGSNFWFVIPLDPCEEPRFYKEETPQQELDVFHGNEKGLHVLVAEDNPTNQLVIKGQLKKLGHSFVVVENGALAVEYLADENNRVDLVLMDYEMPEMDGIAACRQIKLLNNGNEKTPIIALTAHATQDKRQQCMQVGMINYLEKPLNIDRLKVLLSSIPRVNV